MFISHRKGELRNRVDSWSILSREARAVLTANMPPARRPINPFCPGSKARMSTNTQKAQAMGRKS